MDSHDILKKAFQPMGVKSIAHDMNLSSSLLYKWCQPNEDSGSDSGADNPLDRLNRIRELTGEIGPIVWLCEQAGGFYVANPPLGNKEILPIVAATQRLLNEFSDMLAAVSESLENDTVIDVDEARKIRREWEQLKHSGESFVTACEAGAYD
jgi:transposase-like protein